MAKIISLFGSQAEATQALDALAETDWEVETEVVEYTDDLDLIGEGESVAATPPSAGSPLAPPAFPEDPEEVFADVDLDNLDDEAVALLARRVRDGSVLVVADVDDDEAGTVREFLREQGGQIVDKG